MARARLLANDTADLDDQREELTALDLADLPDAALLVATIEHRHRGPVEPTRELAERALDHGHRVGLVGLGHGVGVGAAVEQVDDDPEGRELGRGGLGDGQVG
ncbi:MAG: hypothetical protein ACXWCM_18750, partial [Acidimicrobiales bacterium]